MKQIDRDILGELVHNLDTWYTVEDISLQLDRVYSEKEVGESINRLDEYEGVVIKTDPLAIGLSREYRSIFEMDPTYAPIMDRWLSGDLKEGQKLKEPHKHRFTHGGKKIMVRSPTKDMCFSTSEWIANNHPKVTTKGKLEYSVTGFMNNEIIYRSACPKCRVLTSQGKYNPEKGRDHREHVKRR